VKTPERLRISLLADAGLAFAFLLLAAPSQAADAPLGRYPADPAQVSVAGISSGAFMANQLHVAHSAGIIGAGIVAGGNYGAAVIAVTDSGVQALASAAVGAGMSTPALLKSVSDYKSMTEDFFRRGWIDDPANIARAKVYIFTGGADAVVNPKSVEHGAALYKALGLPAASLTFSDHKIAAGHAWVTDDYGGACPVNAPPYINDCQYDQAGAELAAIYGPLQPRGATAGGRIVAFDQTEFVPGGAAKANGMSDTGYIYIPKACEPGAATQCRLQVVLHGCQQSAEILKDTFYNHVGVNEWADTNNIIVLYPQAHATSVGELTRQNPLSNFNTNPAGCWNWWGYAFDNKFLTRDGVQVSAIWAMINRIDGAQP
jgi:hypothetical protein